MERLGRYTILRELGRGSRGQVYLAKDPVIDRDVVLKTLRTELAGNPDEAFTPRDLFLGWLLGRTEGCTRQALSLVAVVMALIVLVNLMKATKLPLGFDYTRLFHDLRDLQDELRAGAVRRRWGAAYFRPESSDNTLPKE